MPARWQRASPLAHTALALAARDRINANASVDRLACYRTHGCVSHSGTILAEWWSETHGFMLRITKQEASGRVVLKLEGRFSAAWVNELDACWRDALASADSEAVWLDLTDVLLVDVAGQEQLTRMHRAGVRFLTRGCVMRELVREIAESYG